MQTEGTGYQTKGDGLPSGDGPRVSLSSQTSSNGEAIVRDAPREHNAPNLRDRLPESFGETGYARDASAVFGGVGLMSMRRMAALLAGFLLVAMLASASSLKNAMRITVLDSETRASGTGTDDNGVPNDCEQVTFDAYCRSSRSAPMMSTLLVQEGNEPPFRISCRIESKFSRCTPLPKGATFDARREKHGITVYYADDKGKARSQLYRLVGAGGTAGPQAAASAVATQPAPPAAAPPQNSSAPVPVPQTTAPVQSSPAPPPVAAQAVPAEKVKCNFSSTPPGADITIDWRYVGSTPSVISLSTGTHVVVLTLPGFAEWKRELTVAADSVVNVTATLEKTQP